jgi:hypothetical protein
LSEIVADDGLDEVEIPSDATLDESPLPEAPEPEPTPEPEPIPEPEPFEPGYADGPVAEPTSDPWDSPLATVSTKLKKKGKKGF